jgi:flavin reductase (DIM6/NTAB) family NADH-FMN oxidoreductase RutF
MEVAAPLIQECLVNLECRIADGRLINPYNFFILEVVKAHVATGLKNIRTLHYRDKGIFMTSGEWVNGSRFKVASLRFQVALQAARSPWDRE